MFNTLTQENHRSRVCERQVSLLLAAVVCLLCIGVVQGADAPKDADEEYLSALVEKVQFKEGVPDVEGTHLDTDLKRVQSLAKDKKRSLARYLAFKVLCAIKEPNQLEFLLNLLKLPESKSLFNEPYLIKFLAAQVTNEDDAAKLAEMLSDEKLTSQFLWALRNTRNEKTNKSAMNPVYGDDQLSAFFVNEYISYRLDNKLSLNSKDAEPFLRRSCLRKGGNDKDAFDSAEIAARLGFKWSVDLLIKSVVRNEKRESEDLKALHEIERIEFLNACIPPIQMLSGQDFGVPPSGFAVEKIQAPDAEMRTTLESAVQKCINWWKTASQDPQFRLRAEPLPDR